MNDALLFTGVLFLKSLWIFNQIQPLFLEGFNKIYGGIQIIIKSYVISWPRKNYSASQQCNQGLEVIIFQRRLHRFLRLSILRMLKLAYIIMITRNYNLISSDGFTPSLLQTSNERGLNFIKM